jgi:FkbM family methyltransferase
MPDEDLVALSSAMGSHLGTGYGQQTGVFAPRIKALGHDIALSCYYGLQGSRFMWNGITCYPSYNAPYGSDVIIPNALDHFGATDEPGTMEALHEASCRGMIITLGDVWTFDCPLLDEMAVASWVPVDHLAVPDVTRRWFQTTGALPIAMSRFGQQALADAGLDPVYAPHGIDTKVFCPGDRVAAREAAGLPDDAFVIGMVANNIGRDGNRKAFAEQITAFARFQREHPEAILALHTDVDSSGGMRIGSFLRRTLPKGSYTHTDVYAYRKGLNPEAVAEAYRSYDVLTNCSYGEGFGIPIVEAQATGCPVIVTDATAMSELCGAGWKVGWEPTWHDSQGAWAAVPRIGEIVDAYEQAHEKARDENLRAQARAFAQDYDADTVTEKYWRPMLASFEQGLETRRADLAARRASRPTLAGKIREGDGLLWIDRGPAYGDVLGPADHEADFRPVLEGLLPDGGVFLDVGAHVGHWSLRLAGKASRVVAVEANPETASTLRRNIAINDITNVDVVDLAAWDERAWLSLDDPNGQSAGGSTRTLPLDVGGWTEDNGTPLIQADRLDEQPELTGLDRLDLVKLDVEGADIHALRGMAGLLERFRPALFVECHDVYGYYERADLEQALTDLGYAFRIAKSEWTSWQPDGESDELRQCDWLICIPMEEAS